MEQMPEELNITPAEEPEEEETGEEELMPLTVEQERALRPELIRDVENWRMRTDEIEEELKNMPEGEEADKLREETEILQERYYDLLASMDETEPIIETDEAILKAWEGVGLREEIKKLILNLGDLAVALRPETFKLTNSREKFNRLLPRKDLKESETARKLNERIDKLENNDRKSILAIAFEELGVNPNNMELIKEEKTETGGDFKYYKTNRKDILLSFDGTDWWVERKEQIH